MEAIIITSIIIIITLFLYIFINSFNKKEDNDDITNKKIISEFNIIPYSFSKEPFKILKEEEHVICFLYFLNRYFISGQMNGMLSVYDAKTYSAILLIIEHCEPISSLFQLHDDTILTSSADGTMKKIKLLLNNNNNNKKKYLVEFVFYTNKEFIFKTIQLNNCDDIISSNIAKELVLWKKNQNDDYPLYKVEKILLNNEYVRDIMQINNNIIITCGESLQCWKTQNYELVKKLSYICKGNNSLYKISDEYTGVLLQKDGDILLFNNNKLIETKILSLTSFTLTCLKLLTNNIIAVGIFDNKNKKSIINQYILNIKKNENKEDNVNELELIKLKSENIYNDGDYSTFKDSNWQRINIIDEMNNNAVLGFGGQENLKYNGKLMIFKNH